MIEVRNQAEFDEAMLKTNNGHDEVVLVVAGRVGAWGSARVEARGSARVVARDSARVVARDSARVVAWGSARVEAWESASVAARGSARVEAWESASVEAWGSARVVARDSARVVAWGSARVEAWESASVVARDSARVEAWGSASVVAWGSASVVARDSARVVAWGSARVEASRRVAIHIHSTRVKCSGGVQIDCHTPITTVAMAVEDWGLKVSRGRVTLYKAVRDDLKSQRGFAYPIGKTVAAPDFNESQECGGGLHLSPTPYMAKGYDESATRFLACAVAVADLALCSAGSANHDKVKARRVRVAYEVDIWGDRIES